MFNKSRPIAHSHKASGVRSNLYRGTTTCVGFAQSKYAYATLKYRRKKREKKKKNRDNSDVIHCLVNTASLKSMHQSKLNGNDE